MVRVQVPLVPVATVPQLGEHLLGRRRAKLVLPEVPNNVRLPIAVTATPGVAEEAKQPQSTVGCIVVARGRVGPVLVDLCVAGTPVIGTSGSVAGEVTAARARARAFREITRTEFLDSSTIR